MDTDADIRRGARRGLVLFALYTALYAGFVALAIALPAKLASRPVGGVNLAVWYGMALIVAPLLLSVVYLAWRREGPR
jgi:hypothetical protein